MADGGVPVGLRHTLHERTPPGVRFVFGAAMASEAAIPAEMRPFAPGATGPSR